MLLRACIMLRRGVNDRLWSGHPLKSSSSFFWSYRSTVCSLPQFQLCFFISSVEFVCLNLVVYDFFYVFGIVGYIGEFEYVDDHRAGKIVVELNGRLNKCGVISPRFDIGVKEIEGWTARLLPSRQVSLGNSYFAHCRRLLFSNFQMEVPFCL